MIHKTVSLALTQRNAQDLPTSNRNATSSESSVRSCPMRRGSEVNENITSEPRFGGLSPIRCQDASELTECDMSLVEIIPNYREYPSFIGERGGTALGRSLRKSLVGVLNQSRKYWTDTGKDKGTLATRVAGKKRMEKLTDSAALSERKPPILREVKLNSGSSHKVIRVTLVPAEYYPKRITVNLTTRPQSRKESLR